VTDDLWPNLAGILDRPAWQTRGACRGLDPNMFFPDRGDMLGAARAVCAGCPVAAECFDWAMGQPAQLVGVWGGVSHRERKHICKARRKGEAA
jgi:WhiB family redox-sensing transcriptional regulator